MSISTLRVSSEFRTPGLTCAGAAAAAVGGVLSVNFPHELCGLLVGGAVDVPQRERGSSAGEVQREQAAQTTSGPGDHAHAALHALLPRLHEPPRRRRRERPEHLHADHAELRRDVHRHEPPHYRLPTKFDLKPSLTADDLMLHTNTSQLSAGRLLQQTNTRRSALHINTRPG